MNPRLSSQLVTRSWNICSNHVILQRLYVQKGNQTLKDDINIKKRSFSDDNYKVDSVYKRLEAKGYHRFQKAYSPPEDVEEIIEDICQEIDLLDIFSTNPQIKYKLLKECSARLGHRVPISLLHTVTDRESLMKFYKTEVDITVPLDMMKNIDLPKNLHITYEYHRFHPETDTKFGGVSAFPESSTVMSDPAAKKKYPGYKAKFAPPKH